MWSTLHPAPIVWLFDAGEDILRKAVTGDHDFVVLDPDPKKLNLSARIFLKGLQFFFSKNSKLVTQLMGKRRFSLKCLYYCYVIAYVQYLQPRVVVTLIHNSDVFWLLSRAVTGAKFIQIANAIDVERNVTMDMRLPPEFYERLPVRSYCFGSHDCELYARHGRQFKEMIPVGSLRNDLFLHTVDNNKVRYDLCLISQWVFDETSAALYPEIRASMEIVGALFKRYILESRVSSCIALRCKKKDSTEYQHVFNIFGPISNFAPRTSLYSSYQLMKESRLIIGFSSTLLAEGFSWGKKVLMCNPLRREDYDLGFPDVARCDSADYEVFKAKLESLDALSIDEYDRQTVAFRTYLIRTSPERPSFKRISTDIDELLSRSGCADKESLLELQ